MLINAGRRYHCPLFNISNNLSLHLIRHIMLKSFFLNHHEAQCFRWLRSARMAVTDERLRTYLLLINRWYFTDLWLEKKEEKPIWIRGRWAQIKSWCRQSLAQSFRVAWQHLNESPISCVHPLKYFAVMHLWPHRVLLKVKKTTKPAKTIWKSVETSPVLPVNVKRDKIH